MMIQWLGTAGVAWMLAASLAPAAVAQAGRRVTRTPSELLAGFRAAPEGSSSPVSRDITQVLTYPEDYPRQDLEAFLAGLEEIAVHGDGYRLRVSAVVKVYLVGERTMNHPVPGTMDRLQRIYARSEDGSVRNAVLMLVPGVAERDRALEFLEATATGGPGSRDYPWSVRNAVGALARMGNEGGEVLRRLHQAGAVQDPEARQDLSAMARRDFRTE